MIVKYVELRFVGDNGSDDNITYFDKMPTKEEFIKYMEAEECATVTLYEHTGYGIYFEYTVDYSDDVKCGDIQESSIHIDTWKINDDWTSLCNGIFSRY